MNWFLGHRPGLDGLRGVAIAIVVLFHLAPDVFPGGKIGVDLFFVLSGFLITSLLLEEHQTMGRISLRGFYGRRARRLLPALAVMLVVVAVVLVAQEQWKSFISLGYVVAYIANWARASGNLSGAVAHCWSLSIEEQFYIVWPLALIVLLRTRSQRIVLAVVAVAAAAVMFHRIAGNGPAQSDLGTDVRADALLVGCLLALAFAWLGASRWPWTRLALLSSPVLVVEILRPRDLRGYGYTVIALLFACLVAAAVSSPVAERVLAVRPLRALGAISYALYLWHYPVLYWLRGGDDAAIYHATLANALLGLAISLALAIASYLMVERRFMRRRAPVMTHEQMFDRFGFRG